MKLVYCHYEEDGVNVCYTKTSSVTGYCQEHRPKHADLQKAYEAARAAVRGRKVSTEGKSACGQTPDSGSIPDCSTDDNELLVAYEDMADRLESAEARINRLENVVLTLEQQVTDLSRNPPYMYSIPDPTPYNYNYNSGGYVPAPDSGTWSYDKNGGITYSPGVR